MAAADKIAAEARTPHAIAQHRATAANLVATLESWASQRARSERVEVVTRDTQYTEPYCLTVPDQVEADLVICKKGRDCLERSCVLAERREVRSCERVARVRFVRLLQVEPDELTRLIVGQGRQQNSLHDTEHRGGTADAQRECGNHNRRKPRTAPELSGRVPQILGQGVDPRDAIQRVDLFAYQR